MKRGRCPACKPTQKYTHADCALSLLLDIQPVRCFHATSLVLLRYKVLEQKISAPASVLVGDVADEIKADLLLLSAEAVHSKFVDANQLAEFVSCPILLIP